MEMLQRLRKALPHIEFSGDNRDPMYKDNDGDWLFVTDDADYMYDIAREDAELMARIYSGEEVALPTGLLAIVAQAEKELAIRAQIDSLREELEEIEVEGENAPTLYVVSTTQYNGFKPESFAFVTTSEDEAILWYTIRKQERSEKAYGHAFVPDNKAVMISGRVHELDFEDEGYAKALTAYIERLRR